MYKAYHELLPNNLPKYFSVASINMYPKQHRKFTKKFVRTTQKQLCVSYHGIKLWNDLDDIRHQGL